MRRIARLLVCFMIAALPLQVLAGYSVSACDTVMMEQMADGGCEHCHKQEQGDGNHAGKAGCNHCMACFSGTAAALHQVHFSQKDPLPSPFGSVDVKPLVSSFLEPPIHPPQ